MLIVCGATIINIINSCVILSLNNHARHVSNLFNFIVSTQNILRLLRLLTKLQTRKTVSRMLFSESMIFLE